MLYNTLNRIFFEVIAPQKWSYCILNIWWRPSSSICSGNRAPFFLGSISNPHAQERKHPYHFRVKSTHLLGDITKILYCYIMLYYVVSCYVISYYIMICYIFDFIILYSFMLCYIMWVLFLSCFVGYISQSIFALASSSMELSWGHQVKRGMKETTSWWYSQTIQISTL